MTPDEIHIEQLAVDARIGVTDTERAEPQRLVFSITLVPRNDFRLLQDDLQRAVDYAVVADEVKTFVRARVVQLIETMADEVANHLLKRFALREVRIELRKFVLRDTEYVAVRLARRAV